MLTLDEQINQLRNSTWIMNPKDYQKLQDMRNYLNEAANREYQQNMLAHTLHEQHNGLI